MSRRLKKAAMAQEVTLLMECYDEDPTPSQKAFYTQNENEYKEVSAKLDHIIKTCGAELIEKASEQVYVLQMTTGGPNTPVQQAASTPVLKNTLIGRQQTPSTGTTIVQGLQTKQSSLLIQNPQTQSGGVVTRNSGTLHQSGSTYQLMMDPRSGLIVGAQMSPSTPQNTPVLQKATQPPKVTAVLKKTQSNTPILRSAMTTRTMPVRTPPAPKPTPLKPASNPPMVALPGKGLTVLTVPPSTAGQRGAKGRTATQVISQATAKPTENNSVGGLIAGGNKQWKPTVAPVVDLTNDDPSRPAGGGNVPDSREVLFSKLSGKTFPSLVVVARPYLRGKDLPQSAINQGRTALDAKVKSVLMFTPTKFTEYLIQQGYVKSEQGCTSHVTADMAPVKLKLGMYSDVSKFPYSGGYVWISECCPHRFVSVFSGSIFEGAPHPPTVLLKLIYHWSCQTSVTNVVQWVKVDNFYVKNFFTNMRSICTSAVHEKYEKMGGARKRVEVGVISLGTTSQDGNMRQVKVEVLGVMEPESKLVRLRAVEPLQDGEKNYKRRFVKILEPLEHWVHKDSIILTDFTVDKGTLHHMGFSSVYQVSVSESNAPSNSSNKYSNSNVMEYLRRIVPRMFQNTLSLLSRQIIQQFLDELVWRERWGPIPSQCFDNILLHLSEQTKLESSDSLLTRLSRIAFNPFKQWNYKSVGLASSLVPIAKAPTNGVPATLDPVRSGIDMLPQSIRNIEAAPSTSKAPPIKRPRKRFAPELPTLPPSKKLALPTVPNDSQTSLESYYYGTMEGDPNIVKKEYKSTNVVKCCLCPRNFTNNVILMIHLIFHAEAEDMLISNSSDMASLCKYCLKSCATKFALKAHIDEVHCKGDMRAMLCRICDEVFSDKSSLVFHMHRTHVATELPYECGVCTYRTSTHRDAVDHFYETHDGGESLQCPLCLKVVSVSVQGVPMEANLNLYLTHVQKHLRGTVMRKCGRCILSFVNKAVLKDHQDRDHASFRGQPGVRMFVQTNGTAIIMPLPNATPSKVSATSNVKASYSIAKFDRKVLIEANQLCRECGHQLQDNEHFIGLLKCSKCRFMTCCAKAMPEHMASFHGKSSKLLFAKETADLPVEMYCVCGFKSSIGNQLAKHMALCERKTAFTTRAGARLSTKSTNSASFPPLVTLEDGETSSGKAPDRWPKSRKDETSGSAPQSMLNMLGLVRKPSTEDLTKNNGSPPDKAEEREDKKDNILATPDDKVDPSPSSEVAPVTSHGSSVAGPADTPVAADADSSVPDPVIPQPVESESSLAHPVAAESATAETTADSSLTEPSSSVTSLPDHAEDKEQAVDIIDGAKSTESPLAEEASTVNTPLAERTPTPSAEPMAVDSSNEDTKATVSDEKMDTT